MQEATFKAKSDIKSFAARIPMDIFRKVRHFAAEEDISTNAAMCVLLEQALEKDYA